MDGRILSAIKTWTVCKADERLKACMHVQHKTLAHLVTPDPDRPTPMYDEVLSIAQNTESCIKHLANGGGIIFSLEIGTKIRAQKETQTHFGLFGGLLDKRNDSTYPG